MDDISPENHLMEPIFKDGVYENPFNTWKGLPGRGTLWDFMKERWTQSAVYAIPKKVSHCGASNCQEGWEGKGGRRERGGGGGGCGWEGVTTSHK